MMRLGVDAPDEDAKWLLPWNAEIAEDRRKHGQAG